MPRFFRKSLINSSCTLFFCHRNINRNSFSQIYGIIIISSIAFGIANYWGQIVTLFNQIVAVFQEAFSSMSNEVATAMGQLAEDTDCIANSVLTGTVWVEGQTICIERGGQTDKYPCSTKIEAMPQPNSPYFPALLVRVGRSNMF